MRKTFYTLLSCIITTNTHAFEIIHPLDFKGTEKEKASVVTYIASNVKSSYANIGMDNPTTLRMMEKEELKSFKQLTQARDRHLLDNVITQYCNIGICNYSTILMMYNEQMAASKERLEW